MAGITSSLHNFEDLTKISSPLPAGTIGSVLLGEDPPINMRLTSMAPSTLSSADNNIINLTEDSLNNNPFVTGSGFTQGSSGMSFGSTLSLLSHESASSVAHGEDSLNSSTNGPTTSLKSHISSSSQAPRRSFQIVTPKKKPWRK
jgi:hypothetical protein